MQNKILIPFCSLILNVYFLPAQPPSIEWAKCFGGTDWEFGVFSKQVYDGGYLVGGTATSSNGTITGNHGAGDFWIMKLDNFGNLLWQKCFGGTDMEDCHSIELTNDSGFIMAGVAVSTDGDVTGRIGGSDYWVVKCDSIGNIQWQKCYGGSSGQVAYNIIQCLDGGYAVIGNTESNDFDVTGHHALDDVWFLKLSPNGAIEWAKCYGGSLTDLGYCITQTADSGFLFAATTWSTDGDVAITLNLPDCWIVKIDKLGIIEWQKSIGGWGDDIPYSIKLTSDKGFILEGSTTSVDITGHMGGDDIWIVKFDSIGDIQWQKCLGGSDVDMGTSIIQMIDSSYIGIGSVLSYDGFVSGNHSYNHDAWLFKLDPGGNFLWQKCFGGLNHDGGYALELTRDSGIIITGISNSNDGDVSGNNGYFDLWVAKLSTLPDGLEEISNSIIDIAVYQNAYSKTIDLSFYANGNANLKIQLIDITGRILLQDAFLATNGLNKHRIFTGDLGGGIYFVRLHADVGTVTKKVVIQ